MTGPKCPLCGTTIRSTTSALPDGRRGHTACVNAEKAAQAETRRRRWDR